MHSADTITVTVCASPATRARLHSVFGAAPGVVIGGTADDPTSLADQLRDHPADVVLASTAVARLAEWRAATADSMPAPALVILTPDSALNETRLLADATEVSIVTEGLADEALVAAIRAAALGLKVAPQRARLNRSFSLTTREREVLAMLAEGLSNKEISRKLTISANTTKFHVSGILDKLGAGTRAEAVAIALRGGALSR